MIERVEVRGPLASDVSLTALAIEHGRELVTTDGDFASSPALRWRHHLAPSPCEGPG